MSRSSASFTTRIARSFLLLALLAVMMVSTVAYFHGRNALKRAAYSRLELAATLKEDEILNWLESCEEDFLLIAEFPSVQAEMRVLLNSLPASEAYNTAYKRLADYFEDVKAVKPKFTEISLQNNANQIVLSTNLNREGQRNISADSTNVSRATRKSGFAPSFYLSTETDKPAITYSNKIYDRQNNRQGMLLANLKLERIDKIIQKSSNLGESTLTRTYMIGQLAGQTAFISKSDQSDVTPDNEAIDEVLKGISGAKQYNDYNGEPVLGVYHWIADQNVALIAEINRHKALEPARELAITIIIVGTGTAGILFLGVNRLARQLIASRRKIESYSHQLEQTAAAANTANRAKSEFLANMSHELRTPLNAILGFAQLMRREATTQKPGQKQPQKPGQKPALTQNSPHAEYLDIISRSGEHLLNLINDVLSMAKIESGRTTFDPVSFDLRYLLRTLEEMLRMRAEARALQLFVEVGAAVPQYIKTDEGKLRQVLVNLVGNAIKFTQAGHVTLQVSAVDPAPDEVVKSHAICIRVKDTGPGISPTDVENLFNPFYQASATRRTQQGTGLGLTISQKFVGLMGGEITVQTVPGQGSVFSFYIEAMPAVPEDLPSRPLGEVVALAAGEPKYRILVVEDIFSSRRLLVDLLSLAGFDVQAVPNGKEAIALTQTWHPHLIWMDMRMPVMDGYEATRQIRKMNNRLEPKIIALTASAFEEERTAILSSGCDDLVRKPFRTDIIFSKMTEHLGVKYRYADEPAKPEAPELPTLDPEDLSIMPERWRSHFHQAALEVDADALHLLIEQIPPEHQSLREPLLILIQTFSFDELLALVKTYA